MDIERLEKNINYVFKDKNILKTALTHTSYSNERKSISNERLEFLGDAILEFIVSKYLYNNYSKLTEGEMTKVRAAVVCEKSLYIVAKKACFGEFLFLGKGEQVNKTSTKQPILADAVEAVIAAIFLDSNIDEAEKFILSNLTDSIEIASLNVGKKDYKTVLQEKLQTKGNVIIKYNVLEQIGPDHNKIFKVELLFNNKRLSVGQGKSKKEAEMEAAKNALN